jgi:ATP-dependent protease HslVU (ClpYQ) peptidase subunit
VTCVVGDTDGKIVTIGGDSAGVGGFDLTVRADEKVFVLGEFIFGFTTSFRMGQLLRYHLKPPEFKEGQDVFAYMVTSFVDAARTILKNGGFAQKENEVEQGGTFLVGIRGKLFAVQSDYQVAESADPFCAVGCGDQIANGAMYAMSGFELTAKQRVLKALEAAERFSAGVRRPFVVKSVGKRR